MIVVTRLNGKALVVNAELIKSIEATPDTVITFLNGDRILVQDTPEQLVCKAVEYGRQIRSFGVQ